jgi:hypothetical protein
MAMWGYDIKLPHENAGLLINRGIIKYSMKENVKNGGDFCDYGKTTA